MPTSVEFRIATREEDLFMVTVGIPYGHLVDSAGEIHEVWNLDGARQLMMRIGIGQDGITAQQATELEAQMQEAGILETPAAVFEAIRRFKVSEDFVPGDRFALCTDCTDPLTHGYVYDTDGRVISDPIGTLVQGLDMCRTAVVLGKTPALAAVTVFQHMLGADLAPDNAVFQSRIDALPEDVRRVRVSRGRDGVVVFANVSGLEREEMLALLAKFHEIAERICRPPR